MIYIDYTPSPTQFQGVKFQFGELLHRTTKHVILSGVRSTESKNLRISSTFAAKPVPRSFDSLRSLRMTGTEDYSANYNLARKKQMPLGICFFNINLFSGLRWDSGLRP